MPEFTFLSIKQIGALDIMNESQYCAPTATDFAILLGCKIFGGDMYWITRTFVDGYCFHFDCQCERAEISFYGPQSRTEGARPCLPYVSIKDKAINKKKLYDELNECDYDDYFQVEYGEYPQMVADNKISQILESLYQNNTLAKTGKCYTTESQYFNVDSEIPFKPLEHTEYIYENKKYIRFVVGKDGKDIFCNGIGSKLNNEVYVRPSDIYWIEVSPIEWIVSLEQQIAFSKNILFSGVQIHHSDIEDLTFEETDIYKYLNTYFAKDIGHDNVMALEPQPVAKKTRKPTNPYELNFDKVSEETMIKGAVESDIPVFLHGKSSDGKSARVKQIDPDCVILYLRNATPDSLNGKSVYDQQSGKMIDIKPTWLVKLEERCQAEPDKLHILFLDELTNALPSIQGMAFNIVLDREVNGLWKLPSNARIVAAGNELNDSLAANELAEPLFNRFAHIYIETDLDNWLNWAMNNNIHPLICSYIVYKGVKVLRTKYTGTKPNADPRKWEMASKMLYETKNPLMLKTLIGEELANEFSNFCQLDLITLDDVLNDNYDEDTLTNLTGDLKKAITASLVIVDEKNFRKVRDFVAKLGEKYLATFEGHWANTLERLEIVKELRLEKQLTL